MNKRMNRINGPAMPQNGLGQRTPARNTWNKDAFDNIYEKHIDAWRKFTKHYLHVNSAIDRLSSLRAESIAPKSFRINAKFKVDKVIDTLFRISKTIWRVKLKTSKKNITKS